jgi:hypothetical protein
VYKDNTCAKVVEDDVFSQNLKVHKTIWEGSKKMVSYSLAGLGFVGDSILVGTFSVVVPGAICLPIVMLGERAGDLLFRCWVGIGSSGFDTLRGFIKQPVGETILESTQELRCPDVEWMRYGLLKVAACHKDKGEDKEYREQMKQIASSDILNRCST